MINLEKKEETAQKRKLVGSIVDSVVAHKRAQAYAEIELLKRSDEHPIALGLADGVVVWHSNDEGAAAKDCEFGRWY